MNTAQDRWKSVAPGMALALFFHLPCLGGESINDEVLKVDGIKPTYRVNTAIEFKILKGDSQPVSFACAAKVFWQGKFQEYRWDVMRNALKLAYRKPVTITGKELPMKWDIPHQLPSIRPESGKVYRLRVDVLSPKSESIYSPQFRIEP